MAKDLVKTLADLKEKEALKMVEDRLSAGEDPLKILDDARRALEIVGKRFPIANISYLNVFQQGNYFSSNLITANVQTANVMDTYFWHWER
jgi:methanogenic corrinoid protein MtbC1